MSYIKPSLTIEEKKLYSYLLEVAGGMGCQSELSKIHLEADQMEAMQRLKSKGYIRLNKKKFMMLLTVD